MLMQLGELERRPSGLFVPDMSLKVGGVFKGEIRRKGRTIEEFEDHNLVVNEGLNKLLDVMFNAASQISPWYLAPFEGNYTPVAGITAATIVAAATECTAYANATRPEYVEVAAASQVVTNAASRASFVFNATKTIYGAFLTSVSTKSATTGTLFAAVRFSTAKAVESGDEMLLTYALTAASS